MSELRAFDASELRAFGASVLRARGGSSAYEEILSEGIVVDISVNVKLYNKDEIVINPPPLAPTGLPAGMTLYGEWNLPLHATYQRGLNRLLDAFFMIGGGWEDNGTGALGGLWVGTPTTSLGVANADTRLVHPGWVIPTPYETDPSGTWNPGDPTRYHIPWGQNGLSLLGVHSAGFGQFAMWEVSEDAGGVTLICYALFTEYGYTYEAGGGEPGVLIEPQRLAPPGLVLFTPDIQLPGSQVVGTTCAPFASFDASGINPIPDLGFPPYRPTPVSDYIAGFTYEWYTTTTIRLERAP